MFLLTVSVSTPQSRGECRQETHPSHGAVVVHLQAEPLLQAGRGVELGVGGPHQQGGEGHQGHHAGRGAHG